MGQPSSISKMPEEIQRKIADLRRAGVSIARIIAALAELGVNVSHSAMGRHTKELDALLKEAREARLVCDALRDSGPDSDISAANIEMAEIALFKLNMMLRSREIGDLDELMVSLKAVTGLSKNLAFARKADVEAAARRATDIAARETRAAVLAEQRAKLDAMAKAGAADPARRGFDLETLRRVREEIYGLPS